MFDAPQESQDISVTMAPADWQQLLSILQDVAAPYRVTAPLIHKITGQCVAATAKHD
jgi:hypothetical protein